MELTSIVRCHLRFVNLIPQGYLKSWYSRNLKVKHLKYFEAFNILYWIKNNPPFSLFCWRSKSLNAEGLANPERILNDLLRQQSENAYLKVQNWWLLKFLAVFLDFLIFSIFGWFWGGFTINFDFLAWFPARGWFRITLALNFHSRRKFQIGRNKDVKKFMKIATLSVRCFHHSAFV